MIDDMIVWAFSLDEKRIVHIAELADEKRGDACNCICCRCNEEMRARKGDNNRWHFAHKADKSDCTRIGVHETALHKLGKELFKEIDYIDLPEYKLSGKRDLHCNLNDPRQLTPWTVCDSKKFNCQKEKTQIERDEGSFKPDVVLVDFENQELYVEILVKNAVDYKKKEKIREKGTSCIEIDISDFLNVSDKKSPRDELKRFLIEEIKYKQWIYHCDEPKYLKLLEERNRQFQKEYEKNLAEEKAQEEKRLEEERLAKERARKEWQRYLAKLQQEEQERKKRLAIEKQEKETEIEEESCGIQEEPDDELATVDRTNPILEKLNDEQIKPVLQTEGPVLVLAGAGSGKTRVLTSRIAYLVEEKGVPAEAILAITFTNKAANEMKERLSASLDVSRMWVSTIHSMCVRIIRMYAEACGVSSNFSIYSETERNNIIKKSFQECDLEDEKLLKNIKFHIGNAKMLGLSPEEYGKENAGEREIETIVKVYARYQKHLQENNALDFDDLLNETRNLLRRNEDAREYLGGRFRYILVDEFQDTNSVQFEIIKYLASVYGNLFVVGDDDQSIYGWRGAEIGNILDFEKTFKNAKVFKLEQNYRSTKKILKLANTIIKNNFGRKDKTLWTENEEGAPAKVYESEEESGEARYVAQAIAGLMRQGYRFSDFAVLMRLNALSRSFEQEFTADGIPYKIFGGFKFFERKEIKDLLAYLRLVNNPFDSEAALRIINFPKRGIGAKTVDTLQSYAFTNEFSVYDALLDVDDLGFNSGTREKLVTFHDLVKTWIIDSQDMPVNELTKKIVEDTKMREAYADESDESINKRANIDEFINSVEEYCKLNQGATLTEYLNQVTLSTDLDEMDDGNYVTLATIHAVKGLEFPCVFLCGMEENILPVSRAVDNDDDMEEERRLTYVAITRAKEKLYFTRSKSRYLYGKREPTMRSRFMKELASEIELPKETRRYGYGYTDYDDPESYGNSAYAGGRYGSNDDYSGRKTSFGGSYGGYNSSYGGSSYGASGNGYGKSYGGSSYGSSYGNSSYGSSSGGYTYGASSGAKKPTPSGRVFGGIGSATPKPTTGAKDLSGFKIGVKVSHPKFGSGTIVGARGTGNTMILDVAFENLGIKQLSASLAPLTIV